MASHLISSQNEMICKPAIATDNPQDIGIADYILLCTKSYDLDATIAQLKPCIGKNTAILPLLNGVNNQQIIQELLPENTVYAGCVYIVSRLKESGVVENSGNIQKLYFGLDHQQNDRAQHLETLFLEAGIDAEYRTDIIRIIWEKFIFLSALATATTYYDATIGEIMKDEHKRPQIIQLVEEVIPLAKAQNIPLSDRIREKTISKLDALTPESTSSMHSDFQHKKQHTELDSITGYIVKSAQKYGIDTPCFSYFYTEIKKRSSI